MTIDPRHTDLLHWTDFTRTRLSVIIPGVLIPKFDPNLETWQDWGNRILNNAAIRSASAPSTLGYDSWRDWAFRFNQAIGRL